MFNYFFDKKRSISLPYKVSLIDDHIVIEAYGEYLESFLVFHSIINTKNYDINDVYINLNENMLKNINISVDSKDYHNFKFKFEHLLDDSYIDDLIISDSKILNEVSI